MTATTFDQVAPTPITSPATRLRSLDIARGIVMVLMAIDHVRVYAGLPPGGSTPDIFFTRWVTHFAAPAFCFLAGSGAFLNGQKLGDPRALARYLLERGVVLILLELTVIRAAWTFNMDYANYIQGNVIWVLGWCMIILAGLVRFPVRALGFFGLAVIAGQDLLRLPVAWIIEGRHPVLEGVWRLLYLGGRIPQEPEGLSFVAIYAIVPWIGVMTAGYAFGALLLRSDEERRKIFLQIGLGATALFLLLSLAVTTLTHAGPDAKPFYLRLLDQRKYPASQLYLLMTLGPAIAILPWAERARGVFAELLETFGKVPMFYYLLHIPLIHALAIVVSWLRTGGVDPWLFANHPWGMPTVPNGYAWSFPLLYAIFVLAVALLYFPCRWYVGYKARHRDGWARYI